MLDYEISDSVLNFLDSCTKINAKQFKDNKLIKKVIIGKNIETIDSEAFSMCSNIEDIIVDESNKFFYSPKNSNAIVDRKTNMLLVGCKNTIIPECVTSVGPFAFSGQTELKAIHIPSNVTSLGAYAFDGCSSLKEVRIDDGAEEIGECCFKACYELEVLYIPKTLKRIHETAFSVIYDLNPDNYGGLLDDGDAKVHEIHFSGLKENFYRTFAINKLFVLDNNLSYNDMRIVCEDGVIEINNRSIDW